MSNKIVLTVILCLLIVILFMNMCRIERFNSSELTDEDLEEIKLIIREKLGKLSENILDDHSEYEDYLVEHTDKLKEDIDIKSLKNLLELRDQLLLNQELLSETSEETQCCKCPSE